MLSDHIIFRIVSNLLFNRNVHVLPLFENYINTQKINKFYSGQNFNSSLYV